MQQTAPVLHEIEVNVTRLLGAGLTLMAQTPFFVHQPLPSVSMEEFADALNDLEGRNRSIILDASLGEDALLAMHRNATRITQLGVLRRVVRHLERSVALLSEGERILVVRFLGPSADSIFLLGTRILAYLLNQDSEEKLPIEHFTWELLMVDGALQAAQEEIHTTRQLGSNGRRYARATLWSFQVARDALLIIGSR
ncbi:hypothetical protein [Armatimonas sp.]|uniref:hypothetical protein n=1 Tax=Armatimonas sp. TaxID=1872638 RepID=UPI00374DE170